MATVLALDAYRDEVVAEPARREYPAEFITWLENEEERANDTALNDARAVALSFYNGELFGDEEEGRSQIVTRDVAEVIDYMVPSVLRTMVSGDRVVDFEALDAGFKDVLEDATEAVSQQFMQEQSGWRILHDALKAGLLEKTGAIKSYVEEKRTRRTEEVTASQLAEMEVGGIEITGSEPIGEFATLADEEIDALFAAAEADPSLIEQLDQYGPIMRVSWVETKPRFVDVPVPNEELGVAPDAITLEAAPYYHHKTEKTISELREMGLETDIIGMDAGGYGQTSLSRARDGENVRREDIVRDGPSRKVWFLEEYCRYDLDGDGITEFLFVQRVGRHILNVQEIEFGPCEEWCPFPMPHRRIGQSLADKVTDIQRVRSVLLRQAMDNMYQSNMPRILLHENSIGSSTIDDFMTIRPNAFARWTGTVEPKPWAIPFVAGHAFQAMEVLTGERESRTGITRLNQGLDADALNKTATGTALMQAQGQQIEEYIARNFAEFVGRVFEKKYRLMRDYGKPFQIIVDGQPRTVDPSQWPDEMRVMVRVGLGAGNKQQRIANRMLLLNLQKEAAANGDENIKPEHIFNSVKGLVADLQLGQATDYYPDPANAQEAPEEPEVDPQVMKVQADAQRHMQEQEQRHQQAMEKLRIQAFEAEQKAQREQAAVERRAMLEQVKIEAKAAQDQQRASFEANLAVWKAEQEAMLKRMNAAANMSDNRSGGDLSQ